MSYRKGVIDRLARAVQDLSGQKRKGAEYLLAHPREVAMISLRKIAQRARVAAPTLIELARELGFESYVDLKVAFQEEETGVLDYFSAGARALQDPRALAVLGKLSASIAAADMRSISALGQTKSASAMARAVRVLSEARRVYVSGMRATYGAAHYMAYLLQLVREGVVFLDDAACMAADQLSAIGEADALIVFGFYPYINRTLSLVHLAEEARAQVVAMTDKPKSPLAVPGSTVLLFRADSPWVVGSITAAISISQMLVAQLVGRGGDTVLRRLRSRERLLTDQRIFAP